MKTTHQSCQRCHRWSRVPEIAALLAVLFGALPLLMAAAVWAAPMRSGDDSILTGPPPGPCAALAAGADYEGGTDAYGHPVTPADLPGRRAERQPDPGQGDGSWSEVRPRRALGLSRALIRRKTACCCAQSLTSAAAIPDGARRD